MTIFSASVEKNKERLFLTGMLLSMFCWGISWPSGKVLSVYGKPEVIAFFRFCVTFLSLGVIIFFLKERFLIRKQGILDLVGASFFIAFYTWLFFKGLSLGKAGAGGVLVTTLNPVIAYAIMLLSHRQKPTVAQGVGLFTGLAAAAVLLEIWSNWYSIFSAGNAYFLLAAICWALLSIFTSRSSRYGSPVAFSFWMYGICTLIMPLIIGLSAPQEVLSQSDTSFWGNLFFCGTVTTAMATTFYFVATTRLGPSRASSFIFLVPFSAAFGAWIFLEEIPKIYTIIGGTLGILAVYILNRKK